jgi:hypothetical protein
MADWDLVAERGSTGLINGAELGSAECVALITTTTAPDFTGHLGGASSGAYGDDAPGLIVDVTTSDRPILVCYSMLCLNDTNNNGGYVFLLEDGVLVDSITALAAPGASGNAGIGFLINRMRRRNPAPGAHEYKIQFAHWVAGTFKISGTALTPALLEVFEV